MLRKIRSLVSNSDYFGIYDNALSKKECEILINQFKKSPQQEGSVWSHGESRSLLRPDVKKAIELVDTKFYNGSIISCIIREQLIKSIEKYKKEYPQIGHTYKWKYDDDYNVQKYETEEDGFKALHCEHNSGEGSTRILAWMFYLNDAKSGTDYMYYPAVKGKGGRCIIWPASWEYMHRSQLPNKGLKYIVTGWISFY